MYIKDILFTDLWADALAATHKCHSPEYATQIKKSYSLHLFCQWAAIKDGHVLQNWEYGWCYHDDQYDITVDCVSGINSWLAEQMSFLKGQFLHEEVNPRVYLKAMKIVGVSLQPHEKSTIRHIGRAERKSTSLSLD